MGRWRTSRPAVFSLLFMSVASPNISASLASGGRRAALRGSVHESTWAGAHLQGQGLQVLGFPDDLFFSRPEKHRASSEGAERVRGVQRVGGRSPELELRCPRQAFHHPKSLKCSSLKVKSLYSFDATELVPDSRTLPCATQGTAQRVRLWVALVLFGCFFRSSLLFL